MLRLFYDPTLHDQYIDKCIANLTLNYPIFNTHRMAAEYVARYNLDLAPEVQEEMEKFRRLYCSDSSFEFGLK